MSEEPLNRTKILEEFSKIVENQYEISAYIEAKLCEKCTGVDDDEWESRRKKAFLLYKNAIERYKFSKMLPRDELGIMIQASISYMFRLHHSLGEVLLIIDMLGEDTFGEIYMNSFTALSSHVTEQFGMLKKLIDIRMVSTDDGKAELDSIVKLERQVDEDNIVMCRQISVKTGGESDYTCYMMRKIVAELEHISDYVKECAEIIADI
jgi:hypothetical protein